MAESIDLLLTNPTERPMTRFVLAWEREHNETAAWWIEVGARSKVDLRECLPGVASGRIVVGVLPPGVTREAVEVEIIRHRIQLTDWSTDVDDVYVYGDGGTICNTTAQEVEVTVMVAERQARQDGKHYMREESLVLPPHAEIRLPQGDQAEFVLPAFADKREIMAAMKRKYAVLNRKKRKQKKDEQQGQRASV
jgi:hypothetical protein